MTVTVPNLGMPTTRPAVLGAFCEGLLGNAMLHLATIRRRWDHTGDISRTDVAQVSSPMHGFRGHLIEWSWNDIHYRYLTDGVMWATEDTLNPGQWILLADTAPSARQCAAVLHAIEA